MPWEGALTVVAFLCLGLGAWITVNGVFQELPVMASRVPEGYDIFSYVSVAVACANIVPVVYGWIVMRIRRSGFERQRRLDRICIYAVVGVGGITVCILLAALWDQTASIIVPGHGGEKNSSTTTAAAPVTSTAHASTQLTPTPIPLDLVNSNVSSDGSSHHHHHGHASHSVAFLVLVFLGGGIDCITSLLFYPVASRFRPIHVTALLAGEALTGLLASLLALAQTGPDSGGSHLYFSVRTFFGILALIMLLSVLGYAYIDRLERKHHQGDLTSGSSRRQSSSGSGASMLRTLDNTDAVVHTYNPHDPATLERCYAGGYPRMPNNEDEPAGCHATTETIAHGASTGDNVHHHHHTLDWNLSLGRCGSSSHGEEAEEDESVALLPSLNDNSRVSMISKQRARRHLQRTLLLFAGQALLSFIENGLYTTMLPKALAPYPAHDKLVSVAVKAGGAGASIAAGAAYLLSARPRRMVTTLCFLTACGCSAWMLWSSQRPSGDGEDWTSAGAGAVVLVTVCKCAVALAKTALFLDCHSDNTCPHRMTVTGSKLTSGGDSGASGEGEEGGLATGFGGGASRHHLHQQQHLQEKQEDAASYDLFRVGGAGIQVGSLVGAVLFFLLTVTFKVFP